MKRVLAIAAVLLLAAALGGLFFRGQDAADKTGNGKEPGKKKPLPLVSLADATKGTFARTVRLTGSVEAVRVATLASPAEGPVQNLKVREGDAVKAGDVLLIVGRQGASEAALAAAQENMRKAEEDFRRASSLLAQKVIAPAEMDAARTAYEQAKAALAKAEESARDYRVAAPWGGIVSRVMVHDGNYVAPRTPLIEIFDPAGLVVRAAVPEVNAAGIRAGMKAKINLDAFPGKSFSGTLVRSYPELDRRMRTRTVEFLVAEAPALLPGMFARINLELEAIPDAVIVPREAVLVTPAGETVVFVFQDGKVAQRKVKIGIESEGRLQILSGIEPGEKVVSAGNEKLKDGSEVRLPGTPAKPDASAQPAQTPTKGE